MINLILAILFAAVLFGVLWSWLRSAKGFAAELPPGVRGANDRPEGCVFLPEPRLAERIFSDADRQFVECLGNRQITATFFEERKWLAILWLRRTRRAIRQQVREYAKEARNHPELKTGSEVVLFLQYVRFLVVYSLAIAAVSVVGPFAFRRLAGKFADVTERVRSQSGPILARAETPSGLRIAGPE